MVVLTRDDGDGIRKEVLELLRNGQMPGYGLEIVLLFTSVLIFWNASVRQGKARTS